MISPSENYRNRGLMSNNGMAKIQILGPSEAEPSGFQTPGFGGLGTPGHQVMAGGAERFLSLA